MSSNWLRCALLALLAVIGCAPRVLAQDGPFDVYFAHFVGGGGYTTTITLINTGTTTATGFLLPRDSDGRPLTAIQMSIPPRGVSEFILGGSPPPAHTGWATYSGSGGSVSGFATFQRFESGVLKTAAGAVSSRPSMSVTIPATILLPLERFTAFALANPGTEDLTVRVALYTAEGAPAGESFTLMLGPGQQQAQFVHENFPGLDQFAGTLVVTSESGGPFVATALAQIKGVLLSLPIQER